MPLCVYKLIINIIYIIFITTFLHFFFCDFDGSNHISNYSYQRFTAILEKSPHTKYFPLTLPFCPKNPKCLSSKVSPKKNISNQHFLSAKNVSQIVSKNINISHQHFMSTEKVHNSNIQQQYSLSHSNRTKKCGQ